MSRWKAHQVMSGETDLALLVRHMQPQIDPTPYVFCTMDLSTFLQLGIVPKGMFNESEGISIIVSEEEARSCGLSATKRWACITLHVYSSLLAIGFLAAILPPLAAQDISVNPVAGYYHDHLFVPWERRVDALQVLETLREA